MRSISLAVFLLFVACDEPPAPAEVAPETTEAPADERAANQEATPETGESSPEAAGVVGGEPSPEAETPPPEAETSVATHDGVLLAPNAEARVENGARISHSGIQRLAHALGLPRPLHIHGRPLAVPDSAQALTLISFLEDTEGDVMHTELWLLERAEGELFRVGATLVPHVPVPSYNDIAVGAEGLSNVLAVKAQSIQDFDEDGGLEYQVVIELIDAVVCGLGPLTHRHAMIFNLPSLSTALDVQTMESATVTEFRSAILWSDANDDGHPDIDLRVRNCAEWSDESLECEREQDTHVSFLWVETEDRWVEARELDTRVPCGEDG